MATPARRDELLEQIRSLPIEDREYIEDALAREAYESRRWTESPEMMAEIERRAIEALRNPNSGYSLEESISRAHAVAAAVRARKP